MADEHYSGDPAKRKGYFRKEGDGQTIKYRSHCDRGFRKSIYQVHHIIPEDAIYNKAILKMTNAEKREYVLACLWITPWNINEKVNLIGLPDLSAFLIYFDKQKDDEQQAAQKKLRAETGYIGRKIKRFHELYEEIKRIALFAEAANPETYPVHLPVSWGHTKYNYAVADQVKSDVIDALNELKDDHTIKPENIAATFDAIAADWETFLLARAANATYATWKKRYDTPKPAEMSWRKPFTMHTPSAPLS